MFVISFGVDVYTFLRKPETVFGVIADERLVEPKRTSVVFNSILFLGIAKLLIDRNIATQFIFSKEYFGSKCNECD